MTSPEINLKFNRSISFSSFRRSFRTYFHTFLAFSALILTARHAHAFRHLRTSQTSAHSSQNLIFDSEFLSYDFPTIKRTDKDEQQNVQLSAQNDVSSLDEALQDSGLDQFRQVDPSFDEVDWQFKYVNSLDENSMRHLVRDIEMNIRNRGDCLFSYRRKKLGKFIVKPRNVMKKLGLDGVRLILEQESQDLMTSEARSKRRINNVEEEEVRKMNQIKLALDNLNQVEEDLVQKLEYLNEDGLNVLCISCMDVTKVIDDAFNVIFKIIVDVAPMMKRSKIFDSFVTAADVAVRILADLCNETDPERIVPFARDLPLIVDEVDHLKENEMDSQLSEVKVFSLRESVQEVKCLSKDEDADIEEVIQLTANVLETFSQWIRESEGRMKFSEIKKVMDRLADVLEVEKGALLDNGEKYLDKACEVCSVSSKMVKKVLVMIEGTLNRVFPAWKDIVRLQRMFQEIDHVLATLKEVCPYQFAQEGLFLPFAGEDTSLKCFEADEMYDMFFSFAELKVFQAQVISFAIRKDQRTQDDVKILNDASVLISNAENTLIHGDLKLFYAREDFIKSIFKHDFERNEFGDPKSPCFGCTEIMTAIDKRILELEKFLDKRVPMWRHMWILHQFEKLGNFMLREMIKFCPNYHLFSTERVLTLLKANEDIQKAQAAETALPTDSLSVESSASLNTNMNLELELLLRYIEATIKMHEVKLSKNPAEEISSQKRNKDLNYISLFINQVYEMGLFGSRSNQKIDRNEEMVKEAVAFISDLHSYALKLNHHCGNCTQIVSMLKSKLDEFINMLNKEYPQWKELPGLEQLFDALKGVLLRIKERCPKDNQLMKDKFKSKCLTKEEQKDVEEVIKIADELLKKTSELAQDLSKDVTSEKVKQSLAKLVDFANEERQNIDKNGEQILDNLCESCSQSAGYIHNIVTQIETTLDEVLPEWKNFDQIKQVFDQIDQALAAIKQICPYEYETFKMARLLPQECFEAKDFIIVARIFDTWQVFEDEVVNDVLARTSFMAGMAPQVKVPVSNNYVYNSGDNVCFSCLDLVNRVEEVVTNLETFLSKYFPGWNMLPFIPQLENLVHSILDNIHARCEKEFPRLLKFEIFRHAAKDLNCLSEPERENLQEIVKLIDGGLESLENMLEKLSSEVENPQIQAVLSKAAHVVEMFRVEIAKDIEIFASQTCIKCAQFTSKLESMMKQLREFLDSKFPAWQNDGLISGMIEQIEISVVFLHQFCPNNVINSDEIINLPVMNKQGCLDPYQKEQLRNMSMEVEIGLSFAARMLELYADFEVDPVKKYSLEMSAKVIEVIAKDIIENITILADEFCGNCADLTAALRDSVITLENALFDVEPMWKDTPVYSAVVVVTQGIFERLGQLCNVHVLSMKNKNGLKADNCLTPDEDEQLKYYTGKAKQLFDYGAEMIRIYADELDDADEKAQLLYIAKVLQAVSSDIVSNFTKIAEESCGTCLDIIKVMKDMEQLIEKTMTDVDPNWRQNPQYKEIAIAVNTFIDMVQGMCPSTVRIQTDKAFITKTEREFGKKLVDAQVIIAKFIRKVSRLFVPAEALKLAKVVADLDIYRLEKLKQLLDESCHVRAETLINALSNAGPFVQGYMPQIYSEIGSIKASSSGVSVSKTVQDCLSKDSEIDLQIIIDITDTVLDGISKTLTLASQKTSLDEGLKTRLTNIAAVVKEVEENIENNLEQIVEEGSCGKCDDIVKAISDALLDVEGIAKKVDRKLANNSIFDAVTVAINAALEIAHNFCPENAHPVVLEVTMMDIEPAGELPVIEADVMAYSMPKWEATRDYFGAPIIA